MKAEDHSLQGFNFVVQALTEDIGSAVLPAVLYVAPPVSDGAGDGVDFLHFGGGILFDLFVSFLCWTKWSQEARMS